ncbi:RNI-like protein [Gigaspora margarita]|uniref:RNI-like protein n=1 Tax=Gigaspora margarita TaxID=4874 RepID=A0A8H4AUN5_GIGMA|nr:RNI-like protein [Gigaspora margarita]
MSYKLYHSNDLSNDDSSSNEDGRPANVFPPIPVQPRIPINTSPLSPGQFPPSMGSSLLYEGKKTTYAEVVQARVHVDTSASFRFAARKTLNHEVGTLKSRCAYCVAILFTTATSMRTLQSLSNVSADIGEFLVKELINHDKRVIPSWKLLAIPKAHLYPKSAYVNIELITKLIAWKTVFADLQPLQNLRRLNLNSVQLTPPLVPVKPSSLRNFEVMDLSRKLKYLDVGYTRVTDKVVRELKGLPYLSFLNLDFTQVSLSRRNILADVTSFQPVLLNGITKEVCEDEYYDFLKKKTYKYLAY